MSDNPQPDQEGTAPAGAGENRAPDQLAELRAALEKAEATGTENWNRYLRAVAELDNVRKRAARDVEAARRSGVEKLAGELLDIVDSLEMGLETAGKASAESLLEGKEATLRLLRSAFEKFGIEAVDPVGHPFDPQLHEAMSMQPSATAVPGSVLLVLQKGYRLGERLLRPARVIVAGEPVVSGSTRPGGEMPPDQD
ncbi:MAG: nucleotide exchange factor GrpE [Gammaproteobacteria bacterium]